MMVRAPGGIQPPVFKSIEEELFYRIAERKYAVVLELVDTQEELLEARDDTGQSPLSSASHLGLPKLVDDLLNRGADPMSADHRGDTPLHHACFEGWLAVVNLLLQREVNLDVQANDGSTPLHGSCYKNHTDISLTLLYQGADATIRNRAKRRPFDYPAVQNDYEVKQLLIKASEKREEFIRRRNFLLREGKISDVGLGLDDTHRVVRI
jgi:ankyrin repeat protein